MDEYINDLKSYNYNGRLNRAKYWKYILFGLIISFALNSIMNLLGIPANSVIRSLISLAFSILCYPFSVRRLHDLDKSGWYNLLAFVPIVNFFFCIYVGFFKGTDGPNQYGPDPLRTA